MEATPSCALCQKETCIRLCQRWNSSFVIASRGIVFESFAPSAQVTVVAWYCPFQRSSSKLLSGCVGSLGDI